MASDLAMRCVAVALGGAIGSVARYGLSVWGGAAGTRLPWGTLAANGVGCLLMGALMFLVIERGGVSEGVRLLLAVGLLGGLTTFSTFSYEVLVLVRAGHASQAVFYMAMSLAVGPGGAALGWLAAAAVVGRGP
jgi:CrcB protein